MTEKSAMPALGFVNSGRVFEPLDGVEVFVRGDGVLRVLDSAGGETFRRRVCFGDVVKFRAAGRLGCHRVELLDAAGEVQGETSYELGARTKVEENTGRYGELMEILWRTMQSYTPTGTMCFHWKGREYWHYVHWILDHSHTAKGMQYFAPGAAGLVELLSETQREDGLIWSWVFPRHESDHFLSAYGPDDYAREIGDGLVVGRQPLENHCEYNFVDAMHTAWKGSGDKEWLARYVGHAVRALNYALQYGYRYSEKFGLLVRAFTIDSWDFQAEDAYFVQQGIGSNQRIDPERTKFGVFFGDNLGYADACEKLAEMLRVLGRVGEAEEFVERARGIRERLDALVWQGEFFRQREEEDETVKRDFGVDLDAQVAMSNLYALNRGITQAQKDAIVAWYQRLRENLPNGSPGEWYSIYPPFEKPFSWDCGKWDYMNAGVHAHAAGELVRGAYKCGHEDYATDVLERLLAIGRRTKGKILMFAYTGAHEAPPPPVEYRVVDLAGVANMDILVGAKGSAGVDWMGSKMPFDMVNLPSGVRVVGGAPYEVLDREVTGGRVAAAIGPGPRLPGRLEVAVHAKAAALRLAHCMADHREDPMAALLTFRYADGTEAQTGIYKTDHVSNWWYVAAEETPTGGVFWKGPDTGAVGMGLTWCELRNPHPEREIESLVFERVFDGTMYALVALTLADAPVYVPKTFESFGGPDNWSGGLVMAGVQEGLVGVENAVDAAAYEEVVLSPRWSAVSDVKEVKAVTRLATGPGYVAYELRLDREGRRASGVLATSARRVTLRLLLPAEERCEAGREAEPVFVVNGVRVRGCLERVRASAYAMVELEGICGAMTVEVEW